jgi:hypothetical protein
MQPEIEAIEQSHPQYNPLWTHLDYGSIIPHINAQTTGKELVALVKERYGPDMNWYDRKMFPFLIHLAHYINAFNRKKSQYFEPSPESNVMVQTGMEEDGEAIFEPIDLTPWMEELASYSPEKREVRLYTNGEYKRNSERLLATLVQSVDSSALFAKGYAFNSLLHCVRDDKSSTIHKYRNMEDKSLRSSIAVVLPNGMVKLIQRRSNNTNNWDSLGRRLLPIPDENTFTLEEIASMPEMEIQHVIDCSGESARRKIPPYCLCPTAHSGFVVDTEKGELFGSFDHAVADGTVMQSFFMQIMYDLENHHQSALLPREEITLDGQSDERFTLLSHPDERKQAIGLINMPDLSYTDLMMVLMHSRANDPKTGFRSVTGTATSNYPRRVEGSRLQAHYAAMENRIGIFQEQYKRHRNYIEVLNTIRNRLEKAYGKDAWVRMAKNNYSDNFFKVIPSDELQLFFRLREQSEAIIRAEIAEAREDRSMSSKIINMFHGKNMSWGATRIAQRLIRPKLLGNVNGTLLSQMTLDEGQTRPKSSPDYFFTTITPDRNNAGLTKLRRSIITNRAFYRKNMSAFIDDLDRNPQTLSRTTHVLYVEDKKPESARQKATALLDELHQNWILMSTLIDMAA